MTLAACGVLRVRASTARRVLSATALDERKFSKSRGECDDPGAPVKTLGPFGNTTMSPRRSVGSVNSPATISASESTTGSFGTLGISRTGGRLASSTFGRGRLTITLRRTGGGT